jgi:hypothetical protein
MRWQADSWKRVRDTVNGTQYLLNTNRLDSIRVHTGDAASGTSDLYYFDNIFDHRDSGHYMVLNYPVDDLVHEIDTALTHAYMTLAVYTNNDPTLDTVDTEIGVGYFAYAVADVNVATRSWVTYAESGWATKTVLVNNTLAALLAMV